MSTIEKVIVSTLILLILSMEVEQRANYPNSETINHVIDWLFTLSNAIGWLIAIYVLHMQDKKRLGEK